jgi:hypothetical protein
LKGVITYSHYVYDVNNWLHFLWALGQQHSLSNVVGHIHDHGITNEKGKPHFNQRRGGHYYLSGDCGWWRFLKRMAADRWVRETNKDRVPRENRQRPGYTSNCGGWGSGLLVAEFTGSTSPSVKQFPFTGDLNYSKVWGGEHVYYPMIEGAFDGGLGFGMGELST